MKKTYLLTAVCLLLAGCGSEIGLTSGEPVQTSAQTTYQTTAQTETQTTAQTTVQTAALTDASDTETVLPASDSSTAEEPGILSSSDDIGLYDTDGSGMNYSFTYNGESFSAVYTPDNWKIIDSYKITNKADIELICEALISVYPIHGADMESWRTPEDLAYEWMEHNAAYMLLVDNSKWKANVKDVDLNPEDQGKSGIQMALDRIGDRNT